MPSKSTKTKPLTVQNAGSGDDSDVASVGATGGGDDLKSQLQMSGPSMTQTTTSVHSQTTTPMTQSTQPTQTLTSAPFTSQSILSSSGPSFTQPRYDPSYSSYSSGGGGFNPPQFPQFSRPTESISSHSLIDISPVYLYDRSNWAEFKKTLTECGGSWNLPHWMTTILRGGDEWKLMEQDGHDMESIFPTTVKRTAGDGMESKNSSLARSLIASLGLPKNLGDTIRIDVQYCCLSTVEYEDDRRLPARQKMWNWLVKSLKGNRSTVGPYHYLVDEVKPYDVYALFKRLVRVLEQITICSLDD